MPEEYLPSSSPRVLAEVGFPPFATIIDFSVPSMARSGEPINISILTENTGDLYGSCYIDLWDADTGELLFRSQDAEFGAGLQALFTTTLIMPNHDLELIVQTHHDDNTTIDDIQQKRIPLLVQVITALSINIEPPIIETGGIYTQSGRLTRVDDGAGLGGERISLRRDGVEIVWVVTDGAGNYSSQLTAPVTPRSYACQSFYDGNINLGYANTVSDTMEFVIPYIPLPQLTTFQWVALIVSLFTGGILAFGYIRRKE